MGLINILKPLVTFFFAAPLINHRNINTFFHQFFWECWESTQGQLGPEASMLTIMLCCPPAPPLHNCSGMCTEWVVWCIKSLRCLRGLHTPGLLLHLLVFSPNLSCKLADLYFRAFDVVRRDAIVGLTVTQSEVRLPVTSVEFLSIRSRPEKWSRSLKRNRDFRTSPKTGHEPRTFFFQLPIQSAYFCVSPHRWLCYDF